jgi:hypothetical protein
MSEEFRAPDPTLTDHGDDDVMLERRSGLPYEAHLIEFESDGLDGLEVSLCARWAATLVLNAVHARWFAVPCRECFPDAPNPGEDWALGWQVQS